MEKYTKYIYNLYGIEEMVYDARVLNPKGFMVPYMEL